MSQISDPLYKDAGFNLLTSIRISSNNKRYVPKCVENTHFTLLLLSWLGHGVGGLLELTGRVVL